MFDRALQPLAILDSRAIERREPFQPWRSGLNVRQIRCGDYQSDEGYSGDEIVDHRSIQARNATASHTAPAMPSQMNIARAASRSSGSMRAFWAQWHYAVKTFVQYRTDVFSTLAIGRVLR